MDMASARALLTCMTLQAKLDAFHSLQDVMPAGDGCAALPEPLRRRSLGAMGLTDVDARDLRDAVRESLLTHIKRHVNPENDPDKRKEIPSEIEGHVIDPDAFNDTPE